MDGGHVDSSEVIETLCERNLAARPGRAFREGGVGWEMRRQPAGPPPVLQLGAGLHPPTETGRRAAISSDGFLSRNGAQVLEKDGPG